MTEEKDFDDYIECGEACEELEDALEDNTKEVFKGELEQDIDEMERATFTIKGRECEIAFTRKRIDLYEERHTPIIASFYKNDGMFTFKELSAIAGYGLKLVGGGYFIPNKGEEIVNKLIEANGYPAVYQAVMLALQRDCAFLFMGTGNALLLA